MAVSEQKHLFNNKRSVVIFLLDIIMVAMAYVIAYLLRFDFHIPKEYHDDFINVFLVIILTKPIVFLLSNVYRNIWRYASIYDALEIFKSVTLASFFVFGVLLITRQTDDFSRVIFVLDWLVLMSFMLGSRLTWRFIREGSWSNAKNCGPPTLIVGAGEAGSLLLKEIRKNGDSNFCVIGFVDDDPKKKGMKLHGITVLGETRNLKALIRSRNIKHVIIAMPSANRKGIRQIIDICRSANINVKTLPDISSLVDGSVSISQIKDVEIEDLLGRDQVELDHSVIGSYLTGKRVLVTGAAGSIGSEICRQVANFSPVKLMLLDQAETPLYEIEKELLANFPDQYVVPFLADIRNSSYMDYIFGEFGPEVVFHAAAYKHVPMVEFNPAQAVLNNIFGTISLIEAAHRHNVQNFVMISTDKAVNPTNVMGTTKRVAELYVQGLSPNSATRFKTVRFGNVLGSNGSVIPLFKGQIAKGGPVTVTDREIIRYFMTIPEAAQLVLQAGSIDCGSDILLLDMGEPVRIVELAEELIRLSGLKPYKDIDIVFTGLRPGEKMYEELLIRGEGIVATPHKKIKMLTAIRSLGMVELRQELDTLHTAALENLIGDMIDSLKRLVPEFQPIYTEDDNPPKAFQRLRRDLYPEAIRK